MKNISNILYVLETLDISRYNVTRYCIHFNFGGKHYCDVIMGMMASQISSLAIVCSTVYSDVDKRKHQSSASLAFVRRIHRSPVNSPHKWPVTREMFPFDDVIMTSARLRIHERQPYLALTGELSLSAVRYWGEMTARYRECTAVACLQMIQRIWVVLHVVKEPCWLMKSAYCIILGLKPDTYTNIISTCDTTRGY